MSTETLEMVRLTPAERNGTWTSWNGNISHSYDTLYRPKSEQELQAAVRSSDRIRVCGNRQSSADIAAGTDTLIDITDYTGIVDEDPARRRITFRSGTRLADVTKALEERGWTLPCLPDIDTVTIGGALATGTHGTSGDAHPLAEYMIACRLVDAAGGVRELSAESDSIFDAVRCSLGLLGVFSTVTFEAHPLYVLKVTEEPMRDEEWTRGVPEWLTEYEFVRVLWLPHTGFGYVIRGERVGAETAVAERPAPKFHRYRRELSRFLYGFTVKHPRFTRAANRILRRLFFSARTVSKGTLYGATVTKSRSSTLELAEWSVAMEAFPALFAELKGELDSNDNRAFAHIPMDIRFLKGDRTWLSQAYGGDCVTVGCVTRNAEHADSYAAFDLVERVFLTYDGRPHWAKRFSAGAGELRRLWPRFDDFVALRREMDPKGRFLNPYLRSLFA